MSLERACVNCERCWFLANLVRRETRADVYSVKLGGLDEEYTKKGQKIPNDILKIAGETTDEEHVILTIQRIYSNDQIYAARNEAMRALERVTDTTNPDMAIMYHRANEKNPSIITNEALKACRTCDYSSPRIVETIENLSQKEK